MSASFTISARRLAANKENAQYSTGPKTAEGKARASQNASSHNLFSTYLLQPGESEDFFISFRNPLIKTLNPQSLLELAQADRIVSIHWQFRRLQSAQYHLNQTQNTLFQQNYKKQQEKLEEKRDQYIENCNQFNIPVTDESLAAQGLAEPDPTAPAPQPDPGYFIAQSLLASHDKPQRTTPYERLLTAESKLQSLLSRAMKDYRQLQKDRQSQEQQQDEDDPKEPFCPYVTQTDEDDIDDTTDEEVENLQCQDEDNDNSLTTDNQPPTQTRPNLPQPASRKIEPTCQNDTQSPPNSFGGSPQKKEQ